MAYRLLKTFARVLVAPDKDKYDPNYIMFKPIKDEKIGPVTTIHIDEFIIPSVNDGPTCSRPIEEDVIIVEPAQTLTPTQKSTSSRRGRSKKMEEIPYQRYKSGSATPTFISDAEMEHNSKRRTSKSQKSKKIKSPSFVQLGSIWNEGQSYPR